MSLILPDLYAVLSSIITLGANGGETTFPAGNHNSLPDEAHDRMLAVSGFPLPQRVLFAGYRKCPSRSCLPGGRENRGGFLVVKNIGPA